MEGIALALLLAAAPAGAFDANGVALGATEAAVRKAFPAARCQAMDWRTDAADRRCDDGGVRFAGVDARVTFYLRRDVVQAFDVRFGSGDVEAVAAYLRERYGAPDADGVATLGRGRSAREVRKLRWHRGEDQAEVSAPLGHRRAELNVWRGDFDTEVYRFR